MAWWLSCRRHVALQLPCSWRGYMAETEKERREREEREQAQREHQQRYGDFAWGLPDEVVDDLDAEDEVEQEQVSDGD